MSYILDTNVISEYSKRRPNRIVIEFLQTLPAERVWLSVMTIGEIQLGITAATARNPQIAQSIAQWLASLEVEFAGRILPVTGPIARRWGNMSAGRTRPVVDTLIAATALVHDLTVVTRNERDYRDLGLAILNPWDA